MQYQRDDILRCSNVQTNHLLASKWKLDFKVIFHITPSSCKLLVQLDIDISIRFKVPFFYGVWQACSLRVWGVVIVKRNSPLDCVNKIWHLLCRHEKILVPRDFDMIKFKFYKNNVLFEPESVSIWTPCKYRLITD